MNETSDSPDDGFTASLQDLAPQPLSEDFQKRLAGSILQARRKRDASKFVAFPSGAESAESRTPRFYRPRWAQLGAAAAIGALAGWMVNSGPVAEEGVNTAGVGGFAPQLTIEAEPVTGNRQQITLNFIDQLNEGQGQELIIRDREADVRRLEK